MVFRDNCKYDIAAVSSMGLRLCPAGRQSLFSGAPLQLQATSAETNVLTALSSLGMRAKVLTRFVEGLETSRYIKAELARRGIETEGPDVPQGGPWGYRHQINFADSGFGCVPPAVQNDRAGEVGRSICASDFDAEKLFVEDGCRIFHFSGLIASLSETSRKACLELAKAAKSAGTKVSFDVNYRPSLHAGREKELFALFDELCGLADILSGASYMVSEGKGRAKDLDEEAEYVEILHGRYPDAEIIFSCCRREESANRHSVGACLWADGALTRRELRELDVCDRIGGGDGYLAGVLYGLLKGYDPETCLDLGWAVSAMAVSSPEDYAQPASEQQLREICRGNAQIIR
ncbi:MAG: sugar kinase [Firmicutes bacterium]|nr:sugar kinase [Bacillota bacterium]